MRVAMPLSARAQGIERDGVWQRKIRQDRKVVGSKDDAKSPRQLENLAAKGVSGFLLADIISERRNDCHEILHGDGVRRDLVELFGVCGCRFLFAALALVLHECLETAEPFGGFLAERLLTGTQWAPISVTGNGDRDRRRRASNPGPPPKGPSRRQSRCWAEARRRTGWLLRRQRRQRARLQIAYGPHVFAARLSSVAAPISRSSRSITDLIRVPGLGVGERCAPGRWLGRC